jgi:hypothetical protein
MMQPLAEDAQLSTIDTLIDKGEFKQAYDLSLALAEAGVSSAQVFLGWLYQTGKGVRQDLDQAKRWYRSALKSNSPRAEFYLGTVYWNQSAFPEAIQWFETAAAHGYAPAAYQLARMYRYGVGVERDPELARRFVEQAAGEGHIFARRDLAHDMLRGRRGLSRIPVGLLSLLHLGWVTVTTASKNIEDEALFRL